MRDRDGAGAWTAARVDPFGELGECGDGTSFSASAAMAPCVLLLLVSLLVKLRKNPLILLFDDDDALEEAVGAGEAIGGEVEPRNASWSNA